MMTSKELMVFNTFGFWERIGVDHLKVILNGNGTSRNYERVRKGMVSFALLGILRTIAGYIKTFIEDELLKFGKIIARRH